MEGRGKGECCCKTSRGIEAAMNEDDGKRRNKSTSLCYLRSKKIIQNFFVFQCPAEGAQRLLPVTMESSACFSSTDPRVTEEKCILTLGMYKKSVFAD